MFPLRGTERSSQSCLGLKLFQDSSQSVRGARTDPTVRVAESRSRVVSRNAKVARFSLSFVLHGRFLPRSFRDNQMRRCCRSIGRFRERNPENVTSKTPSMLFNCATNAANFSSTLIGARTWCRVPTFQRRSIFTVPYRQGPSH